jgi:hypothetical protein
VGRSRARSCPRAATRGVASRHQGSSRRGIGGRPECPALVVLDVEELPDAAACRPGRRPAPPPVPRRLAPGRGATPRAAVPRPGAMGRGAGSARVTNLRGSSNAGPGSSAVSTRSDRAPSPSQYSGTNGSASEFTRRGTGSNPYSRCRKATMKIAPRFLALGPIAWSYAVTNRCGSNEPRHASVHRARYPE